MLGWSVAVKARKFAILAALAALIAFGNPAAAQQQDAQRDAAFAKIAAGAEFCRRNLQSAPPDVKLGEVDAFCRCMGIHEAAFEMGGVKEEDRPAMRPALQQMCVGMIRKPATGEPNQAAVPPNGAAAPPPPSVEAQTTVTPQVTNDRTAAFMSACVTSPTLMKGESDATKTSVCKCIIERIPTGDQVLKPEDVSRARDICGTLARPMPASFGPWKVTRSSTTQVPIVTTEFERFGGISAFSKMVATCRDGEIGYQVVGELRKARRLEMENPGHGQRVPMFVINENGVMDRASSRLMTRELVRNEQFYIKNNTDLGNILTYGLQLVSGRELYSDRFRARNSIEMIDYMRVVCGA